MFLREATRLLNEGEYDIACFFAEQALQLRLEALLLRILGHVLRGHGVRELLGLLVKALEKWRRLL